MNRPLMTINDLLSIKLVTVSDCLVKLGPLDIKFTDWYFMLVCSW